MPPARNAHATYVEQVPEMSKTGPNFDSVHWKSGTGNGFGLAEAPFRVQVREGDVLMVSASPFRRSEDMT
jgi:hypothetical protein